MPQNGAAHNSSGLLRPVRTAHRLSAPHTKVTPARRDRDWLRVPEATGQVQMAVATGRLLLESGSTPSQGFWVHIRSEKYYETYINTRPGHTFHYVLESMFL